MDRRSNPILDAWASTLSCLRRDPAIVSARGTALKTFEEIEDDAARALAHPAFTADLRPGDIVAVQLGNSPMLPGILLAAWRKDLIPVLLDRSLDKASCESAINACGASAWVGAPDSTDGPGEPPVRFFQGTPLSDGTQFLKLTSGTTGTPRAIRFTAAQLLADCESICETMGISRNDLNYGVIPWSHSYGFSNLVTPLLCRGVPVVATEDRMPRAILNGLAESGATVFPGLPVFFQKLSELECQPFARLRLCISAGAPLQPATAAAFRAKFGLKLHSFYGSSECGGIAYDTTETDQPAGFVGQPMRGVTLDCEDAEEASRIRIRSAAVGGGYFPEPEPAVLGNGCFSPGDLVQLSESGLTLVGRVSDFINVAGRKLNPAAVESALRSCPGVREVAVFGIPHPSRGEEPIACVAGRVEAEALHAHCAAELPAWQCPRDYWLVDTLPVSERGKLSRKALAEAYRAKAGL